MAPVLRFGLSCSSPNGFLADLAFHGRVVPVVMLSPDLDTATLPAIHDRSRPRPRQHNHNRDLHHRRGPRGEGFSGSDVGSEGGFGRIQDLKASGEGP